MPDEGGLEVQNRIGTAAGIQVFPNHGRMPGMGAQKNRKSFGCGFRLWGFWRLADDYKL